MSFKVRVDVTNPGHFFACCGLFELASRLDPETTACFADGLFLSQGGPSLDSLLAKLCSTPLRQLDGDDKTASRLFLAEPFSLRLDWWKDVDGKELKVWAGTMEGARIAQAMIGALRDPSVVSDDLLNLGRIVYDPEEPTKKVEPFYFDARRAANAHSRDLGFSPNDLELTTTAFPAVEALTLIGVQRFRPSPVPRQRRFFVYRVWGVPLAISVAAVVAAGATNAPRSRDFEFEAWYRTGQKKHKAFRTAVEKREGER